VRSSILSKCPVPTLSSISLRYIPQDIYRTTTNLGLLPISVPLAVALPAAATGLAYFNAKASFFNDFHLLSCAVPAAVQLALRDRRDRANQFYAFEKTALDPRTAGHTLLLFEGKAYSYAQAYGIVLRYGHWLRELKGVRPEEIVAMDFQNSDHFVWVWLGLWSIGAKPAFINYNLTGNTLAHCVKASQTKLMVIDAAVAENVGPEVRAGLPGVEFVVLTPDVEAEVLSMEPKRYPDSDRSEDKAQNLALLVYTSGTTGLPKPAIVSWAKCIVSGNFTSRWLSRTPDDVFYTVRKPPTPYLCSESAV
jgi:hypothetical protein